MISPTHRAAIEAMVEGAAKRLYPETMKTCIVSAWVCLGYPREEIEAIVYKEKQNDHHNAHSTPIQEVRI